MTENQFEQETLGWLAEVGWQHRYGSELAPDGSTPERESYPDQRDAAVELVLQQAHALGAAWA